MYVCSVPSPPCAGIRYAVHEDARTQAAEK